jgi:hypothetical protein
VVEKLSECGRRGPVPLEPVKHSVAFDVFIDSDGQVEQVALRSSTFHLDEVEACMTDALQALSERAPQASLRRREPSRTAAVPLSARKMVANPMVIGAGAAEAVIVVGFLVLTVVVYYQVVRNTKTHRPPSAGPAVKEAPKPSKEAEPEPPPQGDPKTTGPTPPVPPDPPEPPKPKPRCEVAFPTVINCSYIQQAKYPDLKSALDAVIKNLPREWQKRPFTTKGTRGSTDHPSTDHTTYWSADGKTKISIGCYEQCCKNTNDGPVIEEGRKCYELNHARFDTRP